jgi:hypothetical protein
MDRVHCYLKPQSMGLKQPFLHGPTLKSDVNGSLSSRALVLNRSLTSLFKPFHIILDLIDFFTYENWYAMPAWINPVRCPPPPLVCCGGGAIENFKSQARAIVSTNLCMRTAVARTTSTIDIWILMIDRTRIHHASGNSGQCNRGKFTPLPFDPKKYALCKIHDGSLAMLASSCGLVDLLAHQHSLCHFPTTYNRGQPRLDYSFISAELLPYVLRLSILPC